jgi:hypothetical protein
MNWDQCNPGESDAIEASYQSLKPADQKKHRITEQITAVMMVARAMFTARTVQAISTIPGVIDKRRLWFNFLEARSIDVLLGNACNQLPGEPRIKVQWVLAKIVYTPTAITWSLV